MASSCDRKRGYTPPTGAQEQLFVRHIADLVAAVRRTGAPRYTMFCNEREQELACAALSAAGHDRYEWDGGFEGAERRMLCVYEDCARSAPLARLYLSAGADARTLTHRDYLGALLGLRVSRECIGDILCEEEGAQVVVTSSVAELILNELREVGRCRVGVRRIEQIKPSAVRVGKECTVTLASLRLDALLAAMLRVGRAQAVRLIASGAVMINHVPKNSPSEAVFEGDLFSVRGYGKFELTQVGAKSRKDRVFVTFTEF